MLVSSSLPPHWYDAWAAPPRFEPTVEAEYLDRRRVTQVVRLQWIFVGLATLMYIGALVASHLLADPRPSDNTVTLSFALFCAGLLLSLATRLPWLARKLDWVAFTVLFVNACVLMAFTTLTRTGDMALPLIWTLIPLFYAFMLTGLPYRRCVPLGIGLGAFDVIAVLALGLPAVELANHLLMIGYVVATGVMTCSMLERGDRRTWIRARLMQTRSENDLLTGLHNRRYLFEEGTYWIKHAVGVDRPVALLMIDVDFFKHYNDSFGHPAGDRCLRSLSDSMQAGTHHALDIIARLGGEEFAVLMFGCDTAAALLAAEKLRSDIEALAILHPGVPDGCVTVCVGVASIDSIGTGDLEALLLAADLALYRAKKSGRNLVCS